MFIIVDKITKKIKYTIAENYGIQVLENEYLQEVSQDFESKYNIAYDYELIFDDKMIIDITINKTWEQWEKEQNISAEPSLEDYILDLDYRLSLIELGI